MSEQRLPSVAATSWSGRLGLARHPEDRVLGGLAAGIAARLGIGPAYVRAAFIGLALAAGIGVVLYVAGWAIVPEGDAIEERTVGGRQAMGLAIAYLGLLLLLRSFGLWLGDAAVWPVALVSLGLAVIWDRADPARRARLARLAISPDEADRPTPARLVVGGVLLVAGLTVFFTTIDAFAQLGAVLLAVIVTSAGLALVMGPWLWRLGTDLARERRERIRQEERAEFAAHLHDSVLQTLALIQRSDDPRRMISLARAQERELRSWLFGRAPLTGQDRLSTALESIAARIEATHHVPIEVVTVGDRALDDALRAVVAASGEAMTNAARHSGAERVSIYAEVNGASVDVWISDQGTGFDPNDVPIDRKGIAESIVARLERQGGTATVASGPDGTEVHLSLGGT